MIGVSLFVLILDIGHPAELRAFVFYVEVCVYVRACGMPSCLLCACVQICVAPRVFKFSCIRTCCMHVC